MAGEVVRQSELAAAGAARRVDVVDDVVRTVARFLAEFDPSSTTAPAYARDLGVNHMVHAEGLDELVAGLFPVRLRRMLAGRAPTRRAAAPDLCWLPACLAADVHPLHARGEHVRAWVAAMGDRTRPDGKPVLSAQARARRLSAVSSLCAWLVQEDLAEANPCARVNRGRAGLRIDRHHSTTSGLTGHQMNLLVHAADQYPGQTGARNAAVVAVLATLGLRVEELVQLDLDDYGTDSGYRVLDLRRKGGDQQRIPVPPVAAARMDAYLVGRSDLSAELVRAEDAGAGQSRPLFATTPYRGAAGGGRLDRAEVRKIVQRTARLHPDLKPLAGTLHPHVLRHSVATRLLEASVPEWRVQELLGHRDPAMTQRYNRARRGLADSGAHEAGRLLERGLAALSDRA